MPTVSTGETSLDVLKINNSEELIGIIDDVIKTIPELGFFTATPETDNTYTTLCVLQDPKVGFRAPGTFGTHEVAKLGNRTVACKNLDASWTMDTALARQTDWGVARALAIQTMTHMRSALFTLSQQIWYGQKNEPDGFPGLYQLIGSSTGDTSNAILHLDAGGRSTGPETDLTSIFGVSTGIDSIQMAWGRDGRFTEEDVTKQWIANPSNPKNSGAWHYAQQIEGWAGLQVTSQWAFGRIFNLSPTVGLNDDLIYEWLSHFPVGKTPQAIFMSRRSLEQLRKSRTAVNATGAPAPTPTEVVGIPIYVTDAIMNNEETLEPYVPPAQG
jgi:hypothetical protein